MVACVGLIAAASSSAADDRGDRVSPYQAYELGLDSFSPTPARAAGVLMHVRINGGRPLRLVLDSGAEFMVIGAKAGRSLGLTGGPQLELVGLGSRPARVASADNVEVGALSFRNCRVAIVDGTVVEGADGVIPLSLFSDFLVRLNLPEKALELIPYPATQDPAIPSTRGVAKSDPLVVGTVLNEKHRGYVVLDTGAYCSAISREVAGTLSAFQFAPQIRIGAGTGATAGQLVSAAVHFEIAGHELIPNDVVALDLSNLSRHYGTEVVGVLGYPALSPYILTIDYRHGFVEIESPRRTPSRERHRGYNDKSSAQLARR
jgi:hypothetical protein